MRHRERIPLHDHSSLDTGGLVAASTVVAYSGGSSTTTTVSSGGASAAVDVSVADTGALFAGDNVESVLAEIGAGLAGVATPASTVTGPDAYGAAAVVGTSSAYARADHDHGLPAAPSIADILDLPTAEMTTSLVLAPDGAGGVQFRAESGGPGSGDASGQYIVGFDGGGSALAAGKVQDVVAPFSGTISGWTLLGDAAGSAAIGIAKAAYASFPPSVSIVASAPPSVTTAAKATSSTLTGWTTSVSAGDVLRFTLSSTSTFTRLLCVIDYTRP